MFQKKIMMMKIGMPPTCLEAQSQSLMLDVPNYEQL